MDSKLYIKRAENELKLAGIIFAISEDLNIQADNFDIKDPETYYSSVITHSYYCIFYSAKAYLLTKKLRTEPPQEHKKTLQEFRRLVQLGVIDRELLKIYENIVIKADALLNIFKQEKGKRGKFTYRILPQANKEPAKESIDNAQIFFSHIYNILKDKTS